MILQNLADVSNKLKPKIGENGGHSGGSPLSGPFCGTGRRLGRCTKYDPVHQPKKIAQPVHSPSVQTYTPNTAQYPLSSHSLDPQSPSFPHPVHKHTAHESCPNSPYTSAPQSLAQTPMHHAPKSNIPHSLLVAPCDSSQTSRLPAHITRRTFPGPLSQGGLAAGNVSGLRERWSRGFHLTTLHE